jgi:FKBP-type peptidyl-prolyl cis-trans isomerase FkpA
VVGAGAEATAGKAVKVHYTGWLYNTTVANFKGAEFDSSVGKAPYPYTVGSANVIAGFDQGVTGMKVGGKRTVFIPSNLGYGADGSRYIPPNSGLVFDLELVEVK